MLKVIHASDFHLDAPFAALPAELSAARRGEQRELLERLRDLCERERCDLLLLSGDLFDSDKTYYESAQVLARVLGNVGCPVFIAPGNHDFYAARSPWNSIAWPENVHIFKSGEIESVPVERCGCTVHGAAFTGPFQDESPLGSWQAPQDGKVHLMVLHGDVGGRGRYGNLTEADIAGSGLTYLALGHVHACSGLQRAGGTWWAYPGCPEGRGFDELGDKGVLVVNIERGNVSAQFVPLCRRRYQILTVDVTSAATPEAALEAALPRNAGEDICRIILTGESSVEGLDLQALERLAEPWFYSVTLRDQTRVNRNIWERAREDSLTGLFLRRMGERLDAAETAEERSQIEKAVRFGLAALENGEDPCQ